MKTDAKWDTSKPLIWGYYFYDKSPEKLERFSTVLQAEGFQKTPVEKSASYIFDSKYLLYVSENVVHTPKSLLDQCNKLSKLAVENHIEDFDGWEAGKDPLIRPPSNF